MGRILKIFGVNLVVFFLIVFLLEIGARLVTHFHWAPLHPDGKSFRLAQPSPYLDANYFSKEFVEESFRHLAWVPSRGNQVVLPKDFSGKYFHVKDGLRRTTDQPADQNLSHILMFGGSLMYGAEVPDDMTIASQLQRIINQSNCPPFLVLNYGVQGVKASQEFARLRTLNLKKGDIVIFFDGVNDITQGIFRGDPDGYLTKRSIFLRAIMKLSGYSHLVNLVWNNWLNRIIPRHLFDPQKRLLLAERTATNYESTIRDAAAYTTAQGAAFINFLQPSLSTLKSQSDYEHQLQSIIQPGLDLAFSAGNDLMRQASTRLSKSGVLSVDATGIFDDLGEPVYLDYCHVNHTGNKVIVELIFNTLKQQGFLTAQSDRSN